MVNRQTVFKYKTNKGPLHKLPAIVKLLLLLPLSILCMSLPSLWLIAGINAAVLTAFLCRFTLQEQLTDLKPAALYALLMYCLSVFSNFSFLPHPDFVRLALRLILIVQISALVFRTTSSLEIRNVIKIEVISLFICFIPQVFETWSAINQTWKARGGKHGLRKIRMIVFVLISLCFEKAAVKARAIEARKGV